MEISNHELEIMRHTISGPNRNWFGTSEKSKDCAPFDRLCGLGLATKSPAPSFWGDDFVFSLTEKGREMVIENEPIPPKVSKSKQRYKRFLEYGDSFDSFIHFCYWDSDKQRPWN
jgi:hypothetical protein